MIGEYKILTKNSGYKEKVWAKAGQKVKVISVSGNAVTCEDEKGERFPCNIKDLKDCK